MNCLEENPKGYVDIPEMDLTDRRLERKMHRRKLRAIQESISQGSTQYLSTSDLQKLHIQHSSMSLDGPERPFFFYPYGASVLPPETDTLSGYYPNLDDESPYLSAGALAWYLNQYFQHCILPEGDDVPPGSYYSDFGDFNFGQLIQICKSPKWQVQAAWDMPDTNLPHMKVMMYSGILGDDSLFCGELEVIIDVMLGRLRTKSLRPHTIAPVLLFSIVGPHHVRIIEAYFDGAELVVRTTGLYNLYQQNHTLLIQLSKWWLGHASSLSTAVGETEAYARSWLVSISGKKDL